MSSAIFFIEPIILDDVVRQPHLNDVAVMLLAYLAKCANQKFSRLDFRVTYITNFTNSKYPVIGVYCDDALDINVENVENELEAIAKSIFSVALIKHISSTNTSWLEYARKIEEQRI